MENHVDRFRRRSPDDSKSLSGTSSHQLPSVASSPFNEEEDKGIMNDGSTLMTGKPASSTRSSSLELARKVSAC